MFILVLLSIIILNVFKHGYFTICYTMLDWDWGYLSTVPDFPEVFAIVSSVFPKFSYALFKEHCLLIYLENVGATSVCLFLMCIFY